MAFTAIENMQGYKPIDEYNIHIGFEEIKYLMKMRIVGTLASAGFILDDRGLTTIREGYNLHRDDPADITSAQAVLDQANYPNDRIE
jgi:hypothetical protein